MKNSSRSLRPLISFIFPKLFFTTHSNFLDQIETHTRDTLDPISFNNQLTSIAWRNGRSSPAATFNWSSINHVSSIVFYLFIFFFFFFPSPPPSLLPSFPPSPQRWLCNYHRIDARHGTRVSNGRLEFVLLNTAAALRRRKLVTRLIEYFLAIVSGSWHGRSGRMMN